ncbi:MAG: type II toxin-antitoxin system RelE/ParE family toxin [Ignavibacteriae bacterium]|nr:MAG: type II toxin-antitoxin system RelE/ParE family toxin [Ignavibacteriota bacterium]
MSYQIVFSAAAEKQFRNIKKNKSLLRRIEKALKIISGNPYSGKFLTGDLKGYHSYRVGTHRIIYEIIHEQIVVLILKIDKRGAVYS